MERKSLKEYSVGFLMESEKFSLGVKVKAKSSNLSWNFIFVVCSVANSVGTPQHFAAVSTPNVVELVPCGFSVHSHGFCGGLNTFCQEKNQHFHVDRQLVTEKETTSSRNGSVCGLLD